jgi:glycosyltransferase involved in cell wall biosynthesis
MRIAYFSRSYTPHDHRFLSGIHGYGHEVVFLCLEDIAQGSEKRQLPTAIEVLSLHQHAVHTPADALAGMQVLEKAIRKIRPDLLHAGPVPTCGFMAALAGFHPLLQMSWGSDLLVEAERSPAWHWASTYALRHADAFQCDCDAVREKALTLHPLQPAQIVQFPWGIDVGAFSTTGPSAGVREKLGWHDRIVVISNRSWESIYGIETVLKAFQQAAAKDERLRLLLIGHGSLATWVHEFLRQANLTDKVFLAGRVGNDQLAPYLREADIYLSCSHSDGSSISLLEAMAMSLPCVVSQIPGNREWVVPDVGGWLAPVADAPAFAQEIVAAAVMGLERRRQMGASNRAVAELRANWPKNLNSLMAAYERLVQQSKRKIS